jgi:hypothetical protein
MHTYTYTRMYTYTYIHAETNTCKTDWHVHATAHAYIQNIHGRMDTYTHTLVPYTQTRNITCTHSRIHAYIHGEIYRTVQRTRMSNQDFVPHTNHCEASNTSWIIHHTHTHTYTHTYTQHTCKTIWPRTWKPWGRLWLPYSTPLASSAHIRRYCTWHAHLGHVVLLTQSRISRATQGERRAWHAVWLFGTCLACCCPTWYLRHVAFYWLDLGSLAIFFWMRFRCLTAAIASQNRSYRRPPSGSCSIRLHMDTCWKALYASNEEYNEKMSWHGHAGPPLEGGFLWFSEYGFWYFHLSGESEHVCNDHSFSPCVSPSLLPSVRFEESQSAQNPISRQMPLRPTGGLRPSDQRQSSQGSLHETCWSLDSRSANFSSTYPSTSTPIFFPQGVFFHDDEQDMATAHNFDPSTRGMPSDHLPNFSA